jgi:hypothetical protein
MLIQKRDIAAREHDSKERAAGDPSATDSQAETSIPVHAAKTALLAAALSNGTGILLKVPQQGL